MQKIYDRAIELYEHKQYDKAIKLFEELLPNNEILFNIATCHKDKLTPDGLKESYKIFTSLMTTENIGKDLKNRVKLNYISVITYLVQYYIQSYQYNEAKKTLFDGLKFLPKNDIFLYNLGHVFKNVGELDESLKYLTMSLEFNTSHFDTYIEIINIARDTQDEKLLLKTINDGLKYFPNSPKLLNDLGLYYTWIYNQPLAMETYQNALEYCSNDSDTFSKIHTNIGHLYSRKGQVKEALQHYEIAFNRCKTDMIPLQNYAMDSLYLDTIEYKEVLRKHFEIGMRVQQHYRLPELVLQEYKNDKIHIGYVSGDFFGIHPMTHFIKELLTNFNASEFEIYCYSINPLENIPKYSNKINWRNIKYLSLENCVRQIMNDKIDILFDLSGHTAGNRLDIFSNRVAKIQLSYLGYPCITGMPEIDYYIIDKTFNFHGSKTIELPFCYTHYTYPFIPSKLELPFHKNKYITFGSLNNPSKINKSVVDLWDKVLDRFPTSKLVVKNVLNYKFRNSERVKFIKLTEKYTDYLEQYNEIDIALDTFPYSGTTTTCESLLMGTPVITLADRKNMTIHQNTTSSILMNSFLMKLIAINENEFINIICGVMKQIETSQYYKYLIQEAFLYGNVLNGKKYIESFETLMKNLFTKKIH